MAKNGQNKSKKSVILWTLIGIASAAVIAFCIYCFAVVIPEKREAERQALEEHKNQQLTLAPTATVAPTNEPTETPGLTEQPTPTEPAATVKPTAEPTETVVPTETPVITEEPTVAPTEEPTAAPTATSTPEPTATSTPAPTATTTPAPTATSTPIPTPTEVPHEHKWADKEQPATCTTGGRTWEECKCGEIQNEVILEATGHGKLIYTVTKEPTTEAEGKYKETCEVCGTVVNKGNIKKLDPTPIPTTTSTPTPKPTNTPTPNPTATPKPTNTPIPTPTAKPVSGKIVVSGGETTITLTDMAPVEYIISLSGGPGTMELEYAVTNEEVLDIRLEKGNNDRQYTLKMRPKGMNSKTKIAFTLYGTDEYGNRVVCDEVTITVKVEIKEYDPAADGYPVFVESWTYEGFSMEVWQVDKVDYRTSVLIITGEGKVTRDIVTGWTTFNDYYRSIEKIYFSDGITEIGYGLPKEGLKEVRLPSTLKVLGNGAFTNSNLVEVILPDGLERIERGAFSHCYALKKVVLPSTLTYIGRGAFTHKVQPSKDYENSLLEVTIPKSVEWIGYGAFEYRYNLVLTLEKGTDTSGYEEGWNYDGKDDPLTMITE